MNLDGLEPDQVRLLALGMLALQMPSVKQFLNRQISTAPEGNFFRELMIPSNEELLKLLKTVRDQHRAQRNGTQSGRSIEL